VSGLLNVISPRKYYMWGLANPDTCESRYRVLYGYDISDSCHPFTVRLGEVGKSFDPARIRIPERQQGTTCTMHIAHATVTLEAFRQSPTMRRNAEMTNATNIRLMTWTNERVYPLLRTLEIAYVNAPLRK
jgi:hypothetical protein